MGKRFTDSRASVELGLVFTTFFWGINFLVLKDLLVTVPPLALIGFRFAGLLLLSFVMLCIGNRGDMGIRRRDLPRFVFAGLTNYTLYQLCFIVGLDKTSAFSSSLLQATSPIFILILLSTLRLEPVRGRRWVGVVLSFGGIGLFLSDKIGSGFGEVTGDLLTLGAAACFATYNIIGKPLAKRYSQSKVMAYGLLFGAPPLLLVGAPTAAATDWAALPPLTYLLMVYTLVFPIYLAYMLWNRGIARLGIAHTSLYSYVVVVLTGVAAFIFSGESFGPLKLVGALVVVAGLLLTRDPHPAAASVVIADIPAVPLNLDAPCAAGNLQKY